MIAGMSWENKPKVRWKTISVRGLLVLVLAIALWLGWIANKAREQRQAVAALQKWGGFVHYDWEFVDGPVKVPRGNLLWKPTWGKLTPGRKPWAPNWMRRAFGDEYFQSIVHVSLYVDIQKGYASATWVNMGPADDALRALATQTTVRTLQIGGKQVTDKNLSYVGQMTGLEELNISWAHELTDQGFLQLSGLKRLRILEVYLSKFTDTSMEAIGKLTKLEELRIDCEGITDRGLAKLAALTRLKYLSLGANSVGNQQISDAGLELLKNMKELETLDLRGWHVSDEGIANLRELKNLKTVQFGLSKEEEDRRKKLQALLPGVSIE
jgi:hypothetical protein